MTDRSDSEAKDKAKEPPAPEMLQVQADDKTSASDLSRNFMKPRAVLKLHHGAYRPSHKATFVGLSVVVLILIVNAGIITFIIKSQDKTVSQKDQAEVTISSDTLDKLGVSRSTIGNAGAELVVNPNASFNGKVVIGGDISVAGQLKLNSKLLGTDASLTKLESGDTSVSKLNVNGDATVSNLSLREKLAVVGSTQLQGAVTIGQLLTVNNSVNITGNLAVGGTLSMGAFQTNILTVGGHITTRGSAPSVTKGGALIDVDTVSISGNDVSGTVAVNIGTGSRSGIVANVTFVTQYSNTPHVVITAVGSGASDVYVNRSANGFSIGVSSISNGGHAFDFIVMQ